MTDDALKELEMPKSQRRIIEEGVASQTMESLTTGVFLVGLALHFNASNFVIGLLGAIPFLSNLFQIPAIHWVERSRDRRHIVFISSLIGRTFLLCIVITPLITNNNIALAVIVGGMAIRYSIGALGSCAWNSWIKDLLPPTKAGEFIGLRMFYRTGVATLLSVAAAFFIDWWSSSYPLYNVWSYAILFFFGYVSGMISTILIRTIPHPMMSKPEAEEYDRNVRFSYLRRPLKHENFRKLIWFLFTWNFAINLAAPFFTVYMLKTLEYDMVFVLILVVFSQVMHTLTLKLWGRYSDVYSNKNVLRISGSVFIFCILGWTFATFPEKHFLTTPLLFVLHMLMGISMAGVTLASGNIALKLAPRRQATSFLAVKSILISVAAGIAPLFGGVFADYFEDKTLSIDLNWQAGSETALFQTLNVHHWDFFFLLAFFIGLYSLKCLLRVEEEGSVRNHVVVRGMMQDTTRAIRGISSIAGMREACMYPLKMMVNKKRGD